MSQTIASPTQASSLRGFVARVWDEPESRSTLVGIVGVVLFYLLMWLLAPYLMRFDPVVASTGRTHAAPKQFSIELAPDTFAKPVPKPPDPLRFVETNPDAPENIPDKTNNFGAQNQQVAQEKPTPDGKSDRPATEGKKDFESTQIVTGQLTKPVEQMEAVPELPTPPKEATVATPRAEQNPLTGFEKKQGEDKQSFGSNIAKLPENSRPIPERIEGVKSAPLIENAIATQPAIDPLRPRPRLQVTKQVQARPGILAENKFGTSNMGPVAYDAKWNSYGEYLKRLIETVDIRWNDILLETKTNPPSGTFVTVKFVLNSDGQIARIVNVENHSSEAGARACVSGIRDRAPYGVWTDEMKAMLGSEQELTFTFYYQ